MRVRLWGVRGSIPTPGPSTNRYGGNTTCASIEFDENRVLVLDAGTGIRLLGDELAKSDAEISVALTHYHWDHIQGFPFFTPLFQPERVIYFAPHARSKALFEVLIDQMDGARFPVSRDRLPSAITFMPQREFKARLRDVAEVTRLRVNHPGETDGIRIRSNGHTVVFIPDNELDPPYEPIAHFDEIVEFCRHADVLIHDAQYLEEDMPEKRGYGHSTAEQACELASEAEVEHLVLFHHDPSRTDDQLDVVQAMARALLSSMRKSTTCTVAYEGLNLEL